MAKKKKKQLRSPFGRWATPEQYAKDVELASHPDFIRSRANSKRGERAALKRLFGEFIHDDDRPLTGKAALHTFGTQAQWEREAQTVVELQMGLDPTPHKILPYIRTDGQRWTLRTWVFDGRVGEEGAQAILEHFRYHPGAFAWTKAMDSIRAGNAVWGHPPESMGKALIRLENWYRSSYSGNVFHSNRDEVQFVVHVELPGMEVEADEKELVRKPRRQKRKGVKRAAKQPRRSDKHPGKNRGHSKNAPARKASSKPPRPKANARGAAKRPRKTRPVVRRAGRKGRGVKR